MTLPVPLQGIDLGGLQPSDLLMIPLPSVVRLLPPDAPALSTVQVSIWYVQNQPKLDAKIGAEDVLSELRNTSGRDARGHPRHTKAYADGEMAANAYEADILGCAGLANKPRGNGPKYALNLLHPQTYPLDKVFSPEAYFDAYVAYIMCAVAGADGGLLLFWENRKRYMRGLLNMYALFIRGLPSHFAYKTADEATFIRELTRDAIDLLQCEMATTVKKLSQLGKLPDEDGDRKVVPFWLTDVLKADKESRATRDKSTARVGADVHDASPTAKVRVPLQTRNELSKRFEDNKPGGFRRNGAQKRGR